MLNALCVSIDADAAAAARAEDSLRRQGFVQALRHAWSGGSVQGWTHASQVGAAATHLEVATDEGFACCAGPVWYRGRFGRAALSAILNDIAGSPREPAAAIDDEQLRGNFALFLRSRSAVLLANDPLGLQRVYAAVGAGFFSTSWLAARAYAGDREIDEAATVEYVLQGAPHSDSTVARSVSKLPLGCLFDLGARSIVRRPSAMVWPAIGAQRSGPRLPTIDDAVAAIAGHLRTIFAEIAAAFPDRISAALSGGFDSRLVSAGFLGLGERPQLFVYGGADSPDVAIARHVAQAEGLPLDAIDKDAIDRANAPLDLDGLAASALFFDGLPPDGIDDPGADRQTRLAQNAGGRIAVNGGGGEIFRNFFHLPERCFRARDIVRAFYRGFDARVFREPGALRAYEDRMAGSILRALGVRSAREAGAPARDAATRLARAQVELVYPLFRCHHWMGLNNTALLRHGYFCTPLVDLQTVRAAATLPLSWKNAGALESRLIAALHPQIAAHASGYGFGFAEGPTVRARLGEALTCARPVFARPAINALHRRLRRERTAPLLRRYRHLLPGEWRIDPVLRLERLSEPSALARALAVEVVARGLAG